MFNLDPQQFTSLMLFVFWLLASGFVYAYHWFLHRLPATQQAKLQTLVPTPLLAEIGSDAFLNDRTTTVTSTNAVNPGQVVTSVTYPANVNAASGMQSGQVAFMP